MAQNKDIHVYIDWQASASPLPMGILHSDILRGKEVFSFENNPEWLTCKQFRSLDPDLTRFSGKQYLSFVILNMQASNLRKRTLKMMQNIQSGSTCLSLPVLP